MALGSSVARSFTIVGHMDRTRRAHGLHMEHLRNVCLTRAPRAVPCGDRRTITLEDTRTITNAEVEQSERPSTRDNVDSVSRERKREKYIYIYTHRSPKRFLYPPRLPIYDNYMHIICRVCNLRDPNVSDRLHSGVSPTRIRPLSVYVPRYIDPPATVNGRDILENAWKKVDARYRHLKLR